MGQLRFSRPSFQVTFVDQYLGVADLLNSVIFTFLAYIIPLFAFVFCNERSSSPVFDGSDYLFISCATFHCNGPSVFTNNALKLYPLNYLRWNHKNHI